MTRLLRTDIIYETILETVLMALFVYNTMTRRKEEFETIEPRKVTMYVCGVTVYDDCHVGHARSAIVFDVIYRYLMNLGYDVTYLRNFTDIDDKILNRAKNDGVPWDKISQTYIDAFHRDMDALGILRPTSEPKATEHIREMIEAVQKLEEKGLAYAVDGNVFYRVGGFAEYGKLSGRDKEEMMAGARVDVDEQKQDPMDFALWKKSKADEPSWESPWGPGRPGWHIECSSMSQKYFGATFDIHGGGLDLIFPHHENEIAQAEGLTGKPFANYWIHNGPLTREGVKMSKSLGNVLSIPDALAKYHPEEIRLFMLSGHYRKPLDLTDQGLSEAQSALDRLYSTLQRLDGLLGEGTPTPDTDALEAPKGGPARGVWEKCKDFKERFKEAMDDDFNTALALAHLFDLNRVVNQWLEHKKFEVNPQNIAIAAKVKDCYKPYKDVMGLLASKPDAYFEEKEALWLNARDLTREDVERMIQGRTQARKEKNWAKADRIRDELTELGILILDSAEGTSWKVRPGA